MTQPDDRTRTGTVTTGPAAPQARPGAGGRREGSPAPKPEARPEPSPRAAGSVRTTRPGTGAAARGTPRRARLALRRVDPWSVLKLSAVLSLALLVVGIVAVAVLYGVLEGMGVPQAVNETVTEVTAGAGGEEGLGEVLSLRRVLTVTAVVGAVNAVLLTALATLSAFLYNLCADVVGGIDVTLSERD